MTVCKYYLQGRCKFGYDCRYEHSDGGGANRQLQFGGKDNSNRFKWTANQQDNKSSSGRGQASPEDLLADVKREVEQWEETKLWPFSCMSLDKDMPCIPGFSDISANEMRWEAYSMKSTGNLPAYVEKVNQLSKEYKNIRDMFKMPNSNVKEEFKQFISKWRQNPSSLNKSFPSQTLNSFSFTSQNTSTNSAFGNTQSTSSVFGNAQSASSLFGNAQSSNSVFGNAQSSNSVFGNAQNTNSVPGSSNSVFGQKTQTSGSVFGTNNSGTASSSIFGQQAQNTGSVFGQSQFGGGTQGNSTQGTFGNLQGTSAQKAQSSTTVFNITGTIFGYSDASKTSFGNTTSVFGAKTSGGFGNAENSTKPAATSQSSSLYTPKEKLSPEDIAQFEANFFTIGRIPVKPPPRELVK